VNDVIKNLYAIGHSQDGIAGIDADDIVRLARGEHLGARHDAALEALASSPAARDAFRIARAVESDARALAGAMAAATGDNVVTLVRAAARERAPMRWAAAAAVGFVAVGAALFGGQGLRPEVAQPIAAAAPTPESDLIFRSSDEGLASTARKKPASDDLFVDAFGG
jgi:hypothetical protein